MELIPTKNKRGFIMSITLLLSLLVLISDGATALPSDCLFSKCMTEENSNNIKDIDYLTSISKPAEISCDTCNGSTRPIEYWKVLKAGGFQSNVSVVPPSPISFEGPKTLVFSNVVTGTEGQYKCVRDDGKECPSGCIFVKAPGQFDDCPDLRRVGINDVCTDTQVGKVIDGTLMFDTAAIFNLSTSGPCQFHQSSHMAFLYKIDMDSSSVTELFRCTYDNGINDVRKACVDNGRIKVMFNSKDNSSNNAFNFQLLLTNVQPNDSGLYRYEASFLAVETVLRKITKLFNLTDLEFSDTDTTAPPQGSEYTEKPKRFSRGAVLGIIGAPLVAIIVVFFIIFVLICWHKKKTAHSSGMNVKLTSDSSSNNLYPSHLVANINLKLSSLDPINGRPLSYNEQLPEELSGCRESDTRDV